MTHDLQLWHQCLLLTASGCSCNVDRSNSEMQNKDCFKNKKKGSDLDTSCPLRRRRKSWRDYHWEISGSNCFWTPMWIWADRQYGQRSHNSGADLLLCMPKVPGSMTQISWRAAVSQCWQYWNRLTNWLTWNGNFLCNNLFLHSVQRAGSLAPGGATKNTSIWQYSIGWVQPVIKIMWQTTVWKGNLMVVGGHLCGKIRCQLKVIPYCTVHRRWLCTFCDNLFLNWHPLHKTKANN